MGKQLVNFRLRVERTIFVIYKAGLEMFQMPWNKHKNKTYMYLTQTEHTRKNHENRKLMVWYNSSLKIMIFGVIKEIYHVWEGYLRKIPVEGRKISRAERRGKFESEDWYFSQIPLPNMMYLFKILLYPNIWIAYSKQTRKMHNFPVWWHRFCWGN